MKKSLSLKNIVIAAVALIGGICSFLPWASISASVSGISFGDSVNGINTESPINGLGWLTLVVFLAIIGIAACFLTKKAMPMAAKVGISGAGLVAVIVAIVEIIRVNSSLGDSIPAYLAKYASAGAGVGLFLMIAFAVIAAILPWVPFDKMIGVSERK